MSAGNKDGRVTLGDLISAGAQVDSEGRLSSVGGGGTVVADKTLGTNAATITVNPVIPSNARLLTVIGKLAVHGNTDGISQWEHVHMQLNGDTTAGHYAWSVMNSDSTTAISTTTSSDILVGHAIADTASIAPSYAPLFLDFLFPADTSGVRTVSIRNLLMSNFASYQGATGDVNPIQMVGGGFWSGGAAINQVTLFPASGVLAAGSRVIALVA